MIKFAAFDWNGTLLADRTAALKADNVVMTAFGHKPITVTSYLKHFEIPISKYWQNLGFAQQDFLKNADSINEIFNINYERSADKCRTRIGAKQILQWLNVRGIHCAIYSNHVVSLIRRQLNRLNLEACIDDIIGRDSSDNSHMHSRNKEQKLVAYVKRRGYSPAEIISIGDTVEEVEIGKKFNYHSVAITGGYNSTARLKAAKPDFLIHSILDLKKIITQLNQQ